MKKASLLMLLLFFFCGMQADDVKLLGDDTYSWVSPKTQLQAYTLKHTIS